LKDASQGREVLRFAAFYWYGQPGARRLSCGRPYKGSMPLLLFLHVSWTTLDRHPMIGARERAFLRDFLPAETARHGAGVLALGMVSDHVHMVVRLPGAFDIPRLMQGLKGASARIASKDCSKSLTGLRWAKGYHAASVSPHALARAIVYVRAQAQRHPDRAIPDPRVETRARPLARTRLERRPGVGR
jgi:REP-associated tyrosine transposase